MSAHFRLDWWNREPDHVLDAKVEALVAKAVKEVVEETVARIFAPQNETLARFAALRTEIDNGY